MGKKNRKKYAELMHQAQQVIVIKEAVGLLQKAAKLKYKFDIIFKLDLELESSSYTNRSTII